MPELTRKQLTLILGWVLVLGTVALYCPMLSHDFLNYDDPDYILNNPHVKAGLSWSGILWAFQPNAYAANWHPLTWLSHMLDCQLFGLKPAAHHLVNLLFHATNSLLLFVLLKKMTGALWRSAFVAAFFAWHPVHVESVAWASERKDVLSVFFLLLSLLAYANYAATSRNHQKGGESSFNFLSSGSYWLALFFFACGLMSKPMVVTLPFILLLLDVWPLARLAPPKIRLLIIEKIPFFLLMFGSCWMTLVVQNQAKWSSASLPFSFRLENTLISYPRYLSKIFCPSNLALIYPYPHSLPLAGVILAALVLIGISIAFASQIKNFPYLAVGWFWFLGTLVPAIGLVQVGVQSIADRYTYLPSIGIFIIAVWGFNDLLASSSRKTGICALAGCCTLIPCLYLTSVQLTYWKNSLTVFAHTLMVTSDNYAADDCLGKTLNNLGHYEQAARFYEEAVNLQPDYPLAQFDLGMNLLARGLPGDASNHLALAVQLWPSNPDLQYDYAVFLSQRANPQDAITHLQTALAERPDFPQAREALSHIQPPPPANHSTP